MSNPKVLISDRDRKVLCFLFEQKVADLKTLHELFFEGRALCTASLRLSKLVAGNYIKKLGISKAGALQVYYKLDALGFNEIKRQYLFDQLKPYYTSDSVLHDLELSKIRRLMQTCDNVEHFFSENVLQNCSLIDEEAKLVPYRKLNSDASLRIQTSSGAMYASLEYEASKKTHERYAKKIVSYYRSTSITAVLYLCVSREIRKLIASIDLEVNKKYRPKLYFACQSDGLYQSKSLTFVNAKGGKITLK
jgi:hypothetical protein